MQDERTALLVADDEQAPRRDWSEADERALVRKLDVRIFPIAILLNVFCFLERINLGNVHDAIVRQLGMREWQYSMAASMFFLTYILCEVPSNVVLQRVRPSQYLSFLCFSFGLVSSCTIFVTSFGGLVALRLVLGACESGFYPGIVFFLALWFRREERALRISYIASGSSVAGLLGGLLAYAALRIRDFLGIAGWQWLFLIEGIPTMFLSVVCLYLLPDRPHQSAWLSPLEQRIASDRLLDFSSSKTSKDVSRMQQIGAVFRRLDICGLAALYLTMMLNMYAVAFFMPSIIKQMGFSSLVSNLLTAPVYLLAVLCILTMAWHSDRSQERPRHIALGALMSVGGFLGLTLGTYYRSEVASLVAIAVGNAGTNCIMPVALAWVNDVTAGDLSTAVALALVLAVGNVGGLVGPYLYGLTVTTDASGRTTYVWGHALLVLNSTVMLLLTIAVALLRRRQANYLVLS